MPREKKTYVFSHIEDAAVRVYGEIARVRLNRMGVEHMFPRVGRGGLVRYTRTHVQKIIIAMEFNELGISFAASVRLFKACWKQLESFCNIAERAAREGTADVLLYVRGQQPGEKSLAATPHIGIITAERAHVMMDWLSRGDAAPRLSLTNLTAQLKAMAEALEQTRPRLRGRPKSAGVTLMAHEELVPEA